MISTKELDKQTIEVNGKRMAYVEMGAGDPIVFQHDNPTSVIHDWGSALGFEWAIRRTQAIHQCLAIGITV